MLSMVFFITPRLENSFILKLLKEINQFKEVGVGNIIYENLEIK